MIYNHHTKNLLVTGFISLVGVNFANGRHSWPWAEKQNACIESRRYTLHVMARDLRRARETAECLCSGSHLWWRNSESAGRSGPEGWSRSSFHITVVIALGRTTRQTLCKWPSVPFLLLVLSLCGGDRKQGCVIWHGVLFRFFVVITCIRWNSIILQGLLLLSRVRTLGWGVEQAILPPPPVIFAGCVPFTRVDWLEITNVEVPNSKVEQVPSALLRNLTWALIWSSFPSFPENTSIAHQRAELMLIQYFHIKKKTD